VGSLRVGVRMTATCATCGRPRAVFDKNGKLVAGECEAWRWEDVPGQKSAPMVRCAIAALEAVRAENAQLWAVVQVVRSAADAALDGDDEAVERIACAVCEFEADDHPEWDGLCVNCNGKREEHLPAKALPS
jgi:hypothetical protein